MKSLGVVWPLDVTARKLRLLGDGDTPVTFTSARDVAKGYVRLFSVENRVCSFIIYLFCIFYSYTYFNILFFLYIVFSLTIY